MSSADPGMISGRIVDLRADERPRQSTTSEGTDRPLPMINVDVVGRATRSPAVQLPPRRRISVAGAGNRPLEIQHTLRTRLRFLAWLIAALYGALIVWVDLPKIRSPRPQISTDGMSYVGAHLAMAVAAW